MCCFGDSVSLAASAQSTLRNRNPTPPILRFGDTSKNKHREYGKHHIFWVIPNYREDENGAEFKRLTLRQKLKLAFDDSFDPTAFLVAGVFAADLDGAKAVCLRSGCAGFR
jgi:hypothetical protein